MLRLLTLRARMTRTNYLLLLMLTSTLFAWAESWLSPGRGWPQAIDFSHLGETRPTLIALNLGVTLLCVLFSAARLHDIGMSGWWAWVFPVASVGAGWPMPGAGLFLIPAAIAWLTLLIAPGTVGANRYGADPRGWESPEHFERQQQALAADVASARRGGPQHSR